MKKEVLTDKSIKELTDEKIGVLFNDKAEAEAFIQHYSPDYFDHSYRLRNSSGFLIIFVNSWLSKEPTFLVYDLDAEFKYVDEDNYTMELTKENLLTWLNDDIGYEITKLITFNEQ